jgi:hypothetical protein
MSCFNLGVSRRVFTGITLDPQTKFSAPPLRIFDPRIEAVGSLNIQVDQKISKKFAENWNHCPHPLDGPSLDWDDNLGRRGAN